MHHHYKVVYSQAHLSKQCACIITTRLCTRRRAYPRTYCKDQCSHGHAYPRKHCKQSCTYRRAYPRKHCKTSCTNRRAYPKGRSFSIIAPPLYSQTRLCNAAAHAASRHLPSLPRPLCGPPFCPNLCQGMSKCWLLSALFSGALLRLLDVSNICMHRLELHFAGTAKLGLPACAGCRLCARPCMQLLQIECHIHLETKRERVPY
eukprot:914037-Pelagomonas_calceolata.AAC.3